MFLNLTNEASRKNLSDKSPESILVAFNDGMLELVFVGVQALNNSLLTGNGFTFLISIKPA